MPSDTDGSDSMAMVLLCTKRHCIVCMEEAASVNEAMISWLCDSDSWVCAEANKLMATNRMDNHNLFISFHD